MKQKYALASKVAVEYLKKAISVLDGESPAPDEHLSLVITASAREDGHELHIFAYSEPIVPDNVVQMIKSETCGGSTENISF